MAWSYKNFEESEKTKKYYNESEAAKQGILDLGDFKYNTYTESDKIKGLQAGLDAHNAGKPADWMGGTHGATVQDFMDQINNRKEFSYDLNGDALYQQYKDQFVTQGKLASMDTMGQAAAMTGGYGNSFAQNAGQQAYHGYLQQLNDKVPELYQLALDKYNMEGEQLLNKYGIALDAYNREYGEHRDAVSDWNQERSYLTDQLNDERSWEYGLFSDGEDRRLNEYNLAYAKLQDTLNRADSNYWNSRGQDYTEYSNDRNLSYNQHQDSIKPVSAGSPYSISSGDESAFHEAVVNEDWDLAEWYIDKWLANNLDEGLALHYASLLPDEYKKKWGIVDTGVDLISGTQAKGHTPVEGRLKYSLN